MIKYMVFFIMWFVSGYQYSKAHGAMLDTFGCYRGAQANMYHCYQGEHSGRHFIFKRDVTYLAKNGEEPQTINTPGKLAEHAQLSGKASVTDGDTIRFGKTRVRLYGIDAPEIKQICFFKDKMWNCGIEARKALINIIGEQKVSCEKKGKDRYGRIIAVCTVGGVSLNSLMVRGGWAFAYRKYSRDYVDEELIARGKKKGLWKGTFKFPWEWRKNKRRGYKY